MEPVNKQLSDREQTVLLLAADGLTDKEIAKHLGLSQRTVGTYWERMRVKLGHFSRTQLVAQFVRGMAESNESTNYGGLFARWEEGVWIVLTDGSTLYANERIAQVFDMEVSDFEKADARKLIENVAGSSIDRLLQAAQSDNRKVDFQIRKKDGRSLWLSMAATEVSNGNSAPAAIVLRLTDITVQRRVQKAFDSCESSLRFISEHSSDLIARFDSKLTCTFVNPAFKLLLQKEVSGANVSELAQFFVPNDRWVTGLVESLTSCKTLSFQCACPPMLQESTTHLLPLPTDDGQVLEVMSITSVPGLQLLLNK